MGNDLRVILQSRDEPFSRHVEIVHFGPRSAYTAAGFVQKQTAPQKTGVDTVQLFQCGKRIFGTKRIASIDQDFTVSAPTAGFPKQALPFQTETDITVFFFPVSAAVRQ